MWIAAVVSIILTADTLAAKSYPENLVISTNPRQTSNGYVGGSKENISMRCWTGQIASKLYTPDSMTLAFGESNLVTKSKDILVKYMKIPGLRYNVNSTIDLSDMQHDRNYMCSVNYADSPKHNRNTTYVMHMRRKPSGVTIISSNPFPRLDTILKLTCSVSDPGYPLPEIQWQHDNITEKTQWNENENGNFMFDYEIWNVYGRRDYTCKAVNTIGTAESSTIIEAIIAPLEFKHPSFNENETIQTKDTEMNLTVMGTWLGEATLEKDNSGQPIIIKPTSLVQNKFTSRAKYRISFDVDDSTCDTVTEHNGRYEFLVSEKTLDGSTPLTLAAHFGIDIHYAPMWKIKTPRIVYGSIGAKDISLPCDVCSQPVASCDWTRNGTLLPNETQCSIHFTEVLEYHLGVYQCTATNTVDDKLKKQIFNITLVDAPPALLSGRVIAIIVVAVIVVAVIVAVLIVIKMKCKNKPIEGQGNEPIDDSNMTYSELNFKPPVGQNAPVIIHQQHEATEYASIDFLQTK